MVDHYTYGAERQKALTQRLIEEGKTGYELLDDFERSVLNSYNSYVKSDGKVVLRGGNAMAVNKILQYRTKLLKDKKMLEGMLAFDDRIDPERTLTLASESMEITSKVKMPEEERKKFENELAGINSELTGIENGSIGVSVSNDGWYMEIKEGAPLPYTIRPTTSTTPTPTPTLTPTQQSPDVVGVVTTTANNTNAVTASENESTVGEVVTVVDPPVTGVTTSTDNASVGLTTGITPKPNPPKYPEGQTQEELKKMVEEEVGSQIERLKNYYRRGFPTFEITGGNDIPKHDLSEYQLDTESGQGILFTNTGNAKVLGNASLELISNGKKSGGGGFDKDGEAGVVIYAKDGVIHIESVRGTVNIRARKNIQLEAGEDINFIATRDITMEAGRDMVSDIGVDCTEFVGGSKLIDSGGTMSLHSEKQDIETSCGTDPYVCDFHEDIKTEWDKIDALNE